MDTLLARGNWQLVVKDFYKYCISDATDSYPENIVSAGTIDKTGAIRYRQLLETKSQTQFAEDPQEGFSVWWYNRHNHEWNFCKRLEDWDDLRKFLGIPNDLSSIPDGSTPDIPESTLAPTQFFFLRSADGLSGLDVSKKMMLLLLTWLQVLPQFLDFLLVFSMGWSKLENEVSGLWYHLPGYSLPFHALLHLPLRIPQLHRSKFELQLAYLLRAPEVHVSDQIGYRIRPAVVYYSLDWAFRQSKWIVAGTNNKLRRLLMTNSQDRREQHTTGDWFLGSHLDHQLDYHLMLCEWASGTWRWYLNRLNQKLVLINSDCTCADGSKSTDRLDLIHNSPPGTDTWYGYPIDKYNHQKHSVPHDVSNTPHSHRPNRAWLHARELQQGDNVARAASASTHDVSLKSSDRTSEQRESRSNSRESALQDLVVRALEMRECLTSNINTMREMSKVFTNLVESKEFPNWQDNAVGAATYPQGYEEARFERSTPDAQKKFMQSQKQHCVLAVMAFASEIGKHISRQEHMQNKVAALLAAIELSQTAARHAEITRFLFTHSQALSNPLKVQLSEGQIDDIRDPALQSSKDTIAVRVITFVALLFVPGTFISAFFSAGVIKWRDGATNISDEDLNLGALKLWLALTIPITIGSFLISMVIKYQARPRAHDEDLENQRKSYAKAKKCD